MSLPVSVGSAGTSVLWWLYIDHRLYGNDTAFKVKEVEVEYSRDSGQVLLVYAVAATVFTVRKPAAGPNSHPFLVRKSCGLFVGLFCSFFTSV